jgi:hypothetical protein
MKLLLLEFQWDFPVTIESNKQLRGAENLMEKNPVIRNNELKTKF